MVYIGASGQLNYDVTIVANPTMTSYKVGDTVTLTCIVDPPIDSTSSNIIYLWTCSNCFADGMTTITITQTLTAMDSGMIDCSITIDGSKFRSNMKFDLQVTQGIICVYNIIHS